MDFIRIHQLALDCIVGLYPHEREREQRVVVDVELQVETRTAARSGRIAHTVAYDRVAHQLIRMLQFRRYQLIEVAAEELSAMVLALYPPVLGVRLRMEKPAALLGIARAASIEVQRTREALEDRVLVEPWGRRWRLLDSPDAVLWLNEVAVGQLWPGPESGRLRCACWLESGELHSDSAVWQAAEVSEGVDLDGRLWRNLGPGVARVFSCCVLLESK